MLSGELTVGCPSSVPVSVNVVLSCIDGILSIIAFSQLARIHMRNQQAGWTRQKVFHVMIGSSNIGFFIYFISSLLATCERCFCWSLSCRFFLMACPQVLFVAAFLLLLSFWIDLCHQSDDEDEEDEDNNGSLEPLLDKGKTASYSNQAEKHRRCFPSDCINIGSRQKFVILVVVLIFIVIIAFSVLIWIGKGKNSVNSLVVARVYLFIFSMAILFLGGAFIYYGVLLFSKLSRIRSEQASSEMWKVGGLAMISAICFSSCALVAIVTSIPVLYSWDTGGRSAISTSLLIVIYYFIGFSVPSAFVLWVMREMPPRLVVCRPVGARVVTYIRDVKKAGHRHHCWTTATSSQSQRKVPLNWNLGENSQNWHFTRDEGSSL